MNEADFDKLIYELNENISEGVYNQTLLFVWDYYKKVLESGVYYNGFQDDILDFYMKKIKPILDKKEKKKNE